MALNLHTDPQFEKQLEWLSRRLGKTKTKVIKELVEEKYRLKKSGFRLGALKKEKGQRTASSRSLQKELKALDQDHDLD